MIMKLCPRQKGEGSVSLCVTLGTSIQFFISFARWLRYELLGKDWRRKPTAPALTLLATLTLSVGSPFLSLLICVTVLKTDLLPKPSELRNLMMVLLCSNALDFHVLQITEWQHLAFLSDMKQCPATECTPRLSQECPRKITGMRLANAKTLQRNHQCIPFTDVPMCQEL